MATILLTDASDAQLVAAAGRGLSTPKEAPADSFVLHAPLELLARAALLPRVSPRGRDAARERIAELATGYAGAGDPVDAPVRDGALDGRSPEALAERLAAALGAGDLDDVDASARAIARLAPASQLRDLLGAAVAPSLGAAAHGAILFDLLARDPGGVVDPAVIRGALREIARHPGWRLSWFEAPDLAAGAPGPHVEVGAGLVDALVDVPRLGVPNSTFIHPLMHQAEASGLAASVLGPVLAATPAGDAPDVLAARRELGRIAAWSMLQEGPEHAPYGWTHCLTMPQAVQALSGPVDPAVAVAVAATHVLGFRTALGSRALDPGQVPVGPVLADLDEAIAESREAAAATVWHTPEGELGAVVGTLATSASAHQDAHLVKYTLACLDAAALDPHARRLHLAAAASLAAWWSARDRRPT